MRSSVKRRRCRIEDGRGDAAAHSSSDLSAYTIDFDPVPGQDSARAPARTVDEVHGSWRSAIDGWAWCSRRKHQLLRGRRPTNRIRRSSSHEAAQRVRHIDRQRFHDPRSGLHARRAHARRSRRIDVSITLARRYARSRKPVHQCRRNRGAALWNDARSGFGVEVVLADGRCSPVSRASQGQYRIRREILVHRSEGTLGIITAASSNCSVPGLAALVGSSPHAGLWSSCHLKKAGDVYHVQLMPRFAVELTVEHVPESPIARSAAEWYCSSN